MRFARKGVPGQERLAVVDVEGHLRDLSADSLARLGDVNIDGLPLGESGHRSDGRQEKGNVRAR